LCKELVFSGSHARKAQVRISYNSFVQPVVPPVPGEIENALMDIRRCSKEDLDAINERARAWKAKQAQETAQQVLILPIVGDH
jgi:hypothetical protein